MKNRIAFSVLLLLLVVIGVRAQSRAVYQCPNNRNASDVWLENAVRTTISGDGNFSFPDEPDSCAYSRGVKANLNATIGKKYFNLAKNHSFSLVKSGENFFSIERFVFKTEKQAGLVTKILDKRSNKQLKTAGVTFYDYFQVRNNLIFYLADRNVYQNSLPFFQNFKENFLKEQK